MSIEVHVWLAEGCKCHWRICHLEVSSHHLLQMSSWFLAYLSISSILYWQMCLKWCYICRSNGKSTMEETGGTSFKFGTTYGCTNKKLEKYSAEVWLKTWFWMILSCCYLPHLSHDSYLNLFDGSCISTP